jgi:Domain of unknown function (DUF6265)
MKGQEDIERQLAEAQGAWETPPAPELWERLEQRLDGNAPAAAPKRPHTWPFRIVAIALLAVVGAGIWWMRPAVEAPQPQGKHFAAYHAAFATTQPMASAADAAPSARAKGLSFGTNIGIGAKRGSLLAKPTLGDKGHTFSQARSGSIFSMNGSGRLLLSSGNGPATANPIAGNGANVSGSTSPASPTYNGNLGMGGTPAQSYIGTIHLPELNRALIVSNSAGNPIDTVSSLANYYNGKLANDNAYLQLNAASNNMNYQMANPKARAANQQNLQHLKWLLGSWKTQGASGGAIEEWRQKDDFTMIGRGYFVVNGDTIVTEEMRIEQRGPDVYFIIVKDQNHKSMKFRLRSSQPNEAIFQNAAPKSEEEIVLRNRPSTDELERILQSPRRQPPSDNTQKPNTAPSKQIMKRTRQP